MLRETPVSPATTFAAKPRGVPEATSSTTAATAATAAAAAATRVDGPITSVTSPFGASGNRAASTAAGEQVKTLIQLQAPVK